jgi:hypothetical protein
LAQARSALESKYEPRKPRAAFKRSKYFGKLQQVQQLFAGQQRHIGGGFILGGALLAALATIVSFYLPIEPTGLGWWPKTVPPATEIGPPLHRIDTPIQQVAKRRTVAVANVRASPSTSAAVVTTLPRDTEVTPVERRGKWILVKISDAEGTRQQEGWVYEPNLSEALGSMGGRSVQ